MFTPAHFHVTDRTILERFIAENGFASLVSMGNDFPVVSHIPIETEKGSRGKKVLRGHLSKMNPQLQSIKTNENVLVVFQSPFHHYISSSHYQKPDAPTWNYISVQVLGRARIMTDNESCEATSRLTSKYEILNGSNVSLEKLPPKVQKLMKGITGLEVSIEKMDGIFKLSQNRNTTDFQNINNALKNQNSSIAVGLVILMENEKL